MHLLKFLRLHLFRDAVTAALAVGLGASWLVAGPAAAGAASTPKGKSLTVSTATNATFGTILVSGNTVYTLKASKVACTAQCLHIWHELVLPKGVKKAKAGHGVNAAKLGTKKRGRGIVQVTYGGKALYWFVGDTAAGQVNGNVSDTWGRWSVVVTAKPVSAAQPLAPGSTTNTTSSPAPTTAPPPVAHTTTPPTSASVPAPTAPAPMTPTTAAPTTAPPPPRAAAPAAAPDHDDHFARDRRSGLLNHHERGEEPSGPPRHRRRPPLSALTRPGDASPRRR